MCVSVEAEMLSLDCERRKHERQQRREETLEEKSASGIKSISQLTFYSSNLLVDFYHNLFLLSFSNALLHIHTFSQRYDRYNYSLHSLRETQQ